MENVSIFIMTHNEELNIKKCIESVSWSDDIVVLDSYSTDNTRDIANCYTNTRVYQRVFDDYSSQRNFGINEISYKNDWVLILDADETCSEELKNSIFSNVVGTLPHNVFCMRRKTYFKNIWVKHNTSYNVWIERLVRPQRIKFYGIVHEKVDFDGDLVKLSGEIHHYPFSKGIKNWMERRTRYAILEADISTKRKISFANLFSTNPVVKRMAMKKLYNLLPYNYVFYFFYKMFFKMSFLDGIVGVEYIILETKSQYLSSKYLKLRSTST